MKIQLSILLLFSPLFCFSQNTLSMGEVEGRQELSMSEVSGKTSKGIYRYYARGNEEPFTGILYSRHSNGKISSWQQYVNGVGQGQWINYYENGNYKEIGHYEQNRVEGPMKKFHLNGELKAAGNYKDWRIRTGEWKYYDKTGKLVSTIDYGEKGSIEEVQEYYNRGEISKAWYSKILSQNGF
jgi:antitoxin component YwqK of YwqJK toxin-antitoxin module